MLEWHYFQCSFSKHSQQFLKAFNYYSVYKHLLVYFVKLISVSFQCNYKCCPYIHNETQVSGYFCEQKTFLRRPVCDLAGFSIHCSVEIRSTIVVLLLQR